MGKLAAERKHNLPGSQDRAWQIFREFPTLSARPAPLVRCVWDSAHHLGPWETIMDRQPQLSPEALREHLRADFERLCQQVADAVNQAPPGQVINASEEKVRHLLARFRTATYQTAVQLRLEAAQAAFPPSAAPADRQTPAEQGA